MRRHRLTELAARRVASAVIITGRAPRRRARTVQVYACQVPQQVRALGGLSVEGPHGPVRDFALPGVCPRFGFPQSGRQSGYAEWLYLRHSGGVERAERTAAAPGRTAVPPQPAREPRPRRTNVHAACTNCARTCTYNSTYNYGTDLHARIATRAAAGPIIMASAWSALAQPARRRGTQHSRLAACRGAAHITT